MRLSPLTVPYRAFQRASGIIIGAYFAAGSEAGRAVGGPLVIAGVAALALLGLFAYELAYYRRFEYEFTEDSLDIRSGVFSRRERELPYHRIQNVDVTRNFVPRLLGIAAVGFETAGGSSTEGSISYVSADEARRLQREIQRRKRLAQGGDGAESAAPEPEDELFEISSRELGLTGALSFDARVVGALSLLGPGSIPFLAGVFEMTALGVTAAASLLVGGLIVAAWLLGVVVAVVNYYGFRLSRDGDEFRYERGLVRRYSGSIPRSKVQTVTVEDNPLKRLFGYATLTVETAGYSGGGDGNRGSQVAIPIARRDRVSDLAEEIEPFGDPEFERPPRRIRRRYVVRYLIALGVLTGVAYALDQTQAARIPWYGFAGLVPLVPPAAHLKWKHRGFWAGPDHVLTRNGFWNRSIKVVPYYRVQTVVDTRTVFQRRWSVASVTVDTAGSFSILGQDAVAVDIEVADALELRETLNGRLQEALAERRFGPREPGLPSVFSRERDGGR